MSTAVSFDPDLIFVLVIAKLQKISHPKSSFQWIGNRPFFKPGNPATNGVNNEDGMVSSHIRTTAVTWFRNVEKGGFPLTPMNLAIALRRLGWLAIFSSVFGTVEIPWERLLKISDTLKCTSMIFLKFIIL